MEALARGQLIEWLGVLLEIDGGEHAAQNNPIGESDFNAA